MAALMVRDPFLAASFRLLDEFFRTSGNGSRVAGFTPMLDVRETEDDYVVMVDLPGVTSEDGMDARNAALHETRTPNSRQFRRCR